VIAGWAFGYIFKGIVSPATEFGTFIATPSIVVPLFAAFMFFTIMVVYGGVEHGIERWAKVLMPVLLVLMFVIIIRSVTLPGAAEGLEFYLRPDFSKVDGGVILAALGQAFFSLSLGMGAMITYGSYLPKRENILVAGGFVAIFDTMIALLAGFMIFPAVFAFDKDPAGGPALIFVVLPEIFDAMPFGMLMSVLFFLLLSIAALTSTVSLLEVVVSYFVDETRWSRKRAVWLVGFVTFLIGVPSALSAGASARLSDMTWLFGERGFLGMTDYLSIMDAIWGNISLAFGALLISIFVGWIWGVESAAAEIQEGSNLSLRGQKVWSFFIKYVCPIFIFYVLLNIRTILSG
jgi:NSS family neurotransmitter:Na+ symporter